MNLQLLSSVVGSCGGVSITEKSIVYVISGIAEMVVKESRERIRGRRALVVTEYDDGRLRVRAQSEQCGFLARVAQKEEVKVTADGRSLNLKGSDWEAAVAW